MRVSRSRETAVTEAEEFAFGYTRSRKRVVNWDWSAVASR